MSKSLITKSSTKPLKSRVLSDGERLIFKFKSIAPFKLKSLVEMAKFWIDTLSKSNESPKSSFEL